MSSGTLTPDQASATPVSAPPAPFDLVQPRKRRPPKVLVAVVLLGIGALAVARAWPVLFPPPPSQVITASGRIEGREITVAPKDIQGRVVRLMADEGQTVSKGQLLGELDAAQLDARYSSAEAAISALDAQIGQASLDVAYTARSSDAAIAAAEAARSSAQANVARARAVLTNATADYDRAASLFKDGVIARRDFDLAQMALHTSQAEADAADKEVLRVEANLALARAGADTVELKRGQLRALQASRQSAVGQLAEVAASRSERRIISPADGTILSRLVEVGNVVSPGSPLFQMVDLRRLYVKVYIPEPDIGKLRLGDRADITVDAFPNRTFPARISKIHDQAEFTPKNVETAEERLKLVFGVELTFENPDALLKPGMPADGAIHWTATPAARESRHGS